MPDKPNQRGRQTTLRESDGPVVPKCLEVQSGSEKPGNAGVGKRARISRDDDDPPPTLSGGTTTRSQSTWKTVAGRIDYELYEFGMAHLMLKCIVNTIPFYDDDTFGDGIRFIPVS